MKRAEIVIGQCYIAKVSGKLVPVRIEADRGKTWVGRYPSSRRRDLGFTATNTVTNRSIRVTAARLRRKAEPAQQGQPYCAGPGSVGTVA